MSAEYRYLHLTPVTSGELKQVLASYSGDPPSDCPTLDQIESFHPNLPLLPERQSGNVTIPNSTIQGIQCAFCTIQAALGERDLGLVCLNGKGLPISSTRRQDRIIRYDARHISTYFPEACRQGKNHLCLTDNKYFLVGVKEFIFRLYTQGYLTDLSRLQRQSEPSRLPRVIKAVLPGLPAFLDKVRGGHRSSGLDTGRSYPEG